MRATGLELSSMMGSQGYLTCFRQEEARLLPFFLRPKPSSLRPLSEPSAEPLLEALLLLLLLLLLSRRWPCVLEDRPRGFRPWALASFLRGFACCGGTALGMMKRSAFPAPGPLLASTLGVLGGLRLPLPLAAVRADVADQVCDSTGSPAASCGRASHDEVAVDEAPRQPGPKGTLLGPRPTRCRGLVKLRASLGCSGCSSSSDLGIKRLAEVARTCLRELSSYSSASRSRHSCSSAWSSGDNCL
mmetsp:Transcript_36528/g.105226  ORF Transcript_36528/g.105226 Transcript_36528/m.105226 type:complete len:245 (+) Transcript_36528:281-1015(+)